METIEPCKDCYLKGSGLGSGICDMCRGEGVLITINNGKVERILNEYGEWENCTCTVNGTEGSCTSCGGKGEIDLRDSPEYWEKLAEQKANDGLELDFGME